MDKYLVLQRRRVRARHLQGPRADAEEPAPADRGDRIIGAYAAGANTRFIFIRGEYDASGRHPRRRASPRPTRPATSARTSSAPDHTLELVVHRGAGAYICGEETGAARRARGQARQPAPEAAVPGRSRASTQGPTLINNVETLCNVPHHRRARAPSGSRSSAPSSSTGHEGRLGLGLRAAARQLRDRARHPVARAHLRTSPAARPRAARSRPGSPAARPRRC